MPGNLAISDQLLHCMDLLYESAVDAAYWPRSLQAINQLLEGTGGVYLVFDKDLSLARLDHADVPQEPLPLYGALYSQDVRVHALCRLAPHQVYNDASLMNRQRFERSDVFNLVLKPFEMPNCVFASIPQPEGAHGAIVVEKRKPASPLQEQLLGKLAPHVTRAVKYRKLLGSQGQRCQLMTDVIDRLPFGLALLDRKASVIRMSKPLQLLVGRRAGMYYRQRQLHCRVLQDERWFQAAILKAIGRDIDRYSGSTHHVNSGRQILTVTVTPLPFRPDVADSAACMVCVREPEVAGKLLAHESPPDLALTPAERRLAQLLVEGATLAQAAERLQVTINTCKTQLKSVYLKTESRNRADLTRRILGE